MEWAAGGSCFGGFYFFQQASAAEAAGGLRIGRHRKVRKFEAPAAAFGLASHGRATFGAAGLHKESIALRRTQVKRVCPATASKERRSWGTCAVPK